MSAADARRQQSTPQTDPSREGGTTLASDHVAGAGTTEAGAAGVRIGAGGDAPTVVVVGIDADADGTPDVVTADADAFGQMMRNQNVDSDRDSAD